MKKNVMALLAGVALTSLLAFKTVNYELKTSTAEVEQMQGIYLFTDCKPVREFEYLGSEKIRFTLLGSEKYDDIRDRLIKKVKKEYPNANGIILYLGSGKEKADAIRIK